MKKTFVIILTVLFLVGIAGLNAEEGEKRLCHVYGNVHWTGFIPNPPGHNGIEGAHVILELCYEGLVDDYHTYTDEYGDYDFDNADPPVTNISGAYTSATITVIVDEGTGHEQSQMVEYVIPQDPGIPFIAYDEFEFYRVPDRW